jgi:hypothetical protein
MEEDLDEARRLVDSFAGNLQSSISAAGLGARPYAPFLMLCVREALIWRTVELGRCACNALAQDDLAAGILLTRAVIESAAFIWRLKHLLDTRQTYTTPDDLQDKLEQMLVGWKNDPEFPHAVNIHTMINHMDKRMPGVQARYTELSEFAHPNWGGVSGLFSVIDRATYTAQFGHGLPNHTPSDAKAIAASCLKDSLEVFQYAYNSISNTLPEFIAELDPPFDTRA